MTMQQYLMRPSLTPTKNARTNVHHAANVELGHLMIWRVFVTYTISIAVVIKPESSKRTQVSSPDISVHIVLPQSTTVLVVYRNDSKHALDHIIVPRNLISLAQRVYWEFMRSIPMLIHVPAKNGNSKNRTNVDASNSSVTMKKIIL